MSSFEQLSMFDQPLLGILQHCGKIEPFLEAIFFFLARKTDFFIVMKDKEDKMGFPPGVAEKLTNQVFKKYQAMVLKSTNSTAEPKQNRKPLDDINCAPPVAKIVEIESSTDDTERKEQDEKGIDTASRGETTASSSSSVVNRSEDADCYNGSKTEKYEWSQTATDVDIKIQLPETAKKAKDFKVTIKSDYIDVSLVGDILKDPTLDPILIKGKLTKKIKCQESLWSFVPGQHIQLNLEKGKEVWWTAIIEGETEIDKTKIDTTRDISEFDEQTQQDFERVMYDHHQKQSGKPTSKEQKTYQLLEKAWDAEGSPFKGTPFDPSQVNISPDGSL